MALIPSDVFTKYKEFADAMIDELGIPCRLVYPGKVESTPIAVPSHKTIRRVSVNNAAPVGFTHTEDLKVADTEADITLRVYWSQKDWAKAGFKTLGEMQIPEGSVMTIGYLSDMDKIQRADYLIVNTNFSSYQEYKFEKLIEPQPWGLKQDRYFTCIWSRA